MATDAKARASISQQQLAGIANSPEWSRLLHYRESAIGGARSQVDGDTFFLSSQGYELPDSELSATLSALQLPPSENLNEHAVCRFPERWRFLNDRVGTLDTEVTPADCPEFQEWLGRVNPHSVSLIFASYYLNSPSSMFGHTFLRIDPEDVESGSTWLSSVANFGAQVTPGDNSLLYSYRGLFGGYPGYFSVVPYYEKIREYSRLENRDLWEYRLNLSAEESRRLIWHLWELRDIRFDYYFFKENCSYRLLELLEYARPSVVLTEDFHVRAIPIDTVRAVEDAGMIADVHYRPSASVKLSADLASLTSEQQQIAYQWVETGQAPESLSRSNPRTRAKIARAAYGYTRFQQLDARRDSSKARLSLALLREINAGPALEDADIERPSNPESGHDSRMLSLAGGSSDHNALGDLEFRFSYHDLTDNPRGYHPGAAINLGRLRLRQREGESVKVERLVLAQIESHSPQTLFFDPLTWRVKVGAERLYSATDSGLAPMVDGGAGITLPLSDEWLGYGLGMARVEHHQTDRSRFALGAGGLLGVLWTGEYLSLQAESEWLAMSDGDTRGRTQLTLSHPLSKNLALRFNISRHRQFGHDYNEGLLEIRRFF